MRRLLAVALLLLAPPALACGYCIEDRVAAAYDHAVVERAFARRHHVAFFQVDDTQAGGAISRKALEFIAGTTAGVDRGSVRTAPDARTLAVAYDPARTSFGKVHQALEKRLASRKLSLMPLRVMERPAALSAAR